MAKRFTTILFTLMICAIGAISVQADAPRWVRKGVKNLNEQRTNDTYRFVKFNTWDLDLDYLKANRTKPLIEYIEETYAPDRGSVEVQQIASAPGTTNITYLVTYAKDGMQNSIEAMLVDEYNEFDDFEENVFQQEYYQLYAVSEPNVKPLYDKFELTTNYNAAATVKSLIPGLGQLDKGQTTKGYVIMGGEILFVGAALIFDYNRRDARKQKNEGQYVGSWDSKEQSWKNFEIGAISCAGLLYIYNLIDAATSKGARQVVVKPATAPRYTWAPYADSEHVGMSFVINF